MTWLQNSVPLSETISRGKPCHHNPLENNAEATVVASLSGMATSSTYFEKASAMQRMYFSPDSGQKFSRIKHPAKNERQNFLREEGGGLNVQFSCRVLNSGPKTGKMSGFFKWPAESQTFSI